MEEGPARPAERGVGCCSLPSSEPVSHRTMPHATRIMLTCRPTCGHFHEYSCPLLTRVSARTHAIREMEMRPCISPGPPDRTSLTTRFFIPTHQKVTNLSIDGDPTLKLTHTKVQRLRRNRQTHAKSE